MSTNDTSESDSSIDADDADVDDDGSTSSPASRHWLTNDRLAGVLVGGLLLIVLASGTPWYDLGTVPTWVRRTYVGLAASAGAWAFGSGLAERVAGGGSS